VVSSQEAKASEIGLQVLKEGGNAVDSAIAVAYALAVTLPKAGNLGGGGFMLVHSAKDKKTTLSTFVKWLHPPRRAICIWMKMARLIKSAPVSVRKASAFREL